MWSILTSFQNNFPYNVQTNIVTAEMNLPYQILLCWGLRSFLGALIRLHFLIFQGSQDDVSVLDKQVLARKMIHN